MDNFFEIKDFSCGYSKGFRIENINFSMKKGGFMGIIGPNGSGKSTLFRGITGELKPLHGRVELNKTSIHSMDYRKKARNIAIVTQKIEAADISVYDYILMGRIPYHKKFQFFETKKDIEIARKYIALTDLEYLKDKNLNQLSGGEQQLASIARALVQEPDLLLLDEPTSHLDISHTAQVLNLIQRLNSQLELTVIMIIHDLNLAGEYCDHLVLLNKGRICKMGLPEEVLNYQNIEQVYGTVVITKTNPLSNKPVIFLVSEKTLKQYQK